MVNPIVSILIPNYNKASYLVETLNSIIEQQFTKWECIVVDDHSTDGSWDILSDFCTQDSRIKIFHRPKSLPKGANSCRNFAFSLAKGEFIQWFDSDDLMLSFFLKDRIKIILATEADFVVGNGQKFCGNPMDLVFSPLFTFPFFINGFLCIDPPWMTPSTLIRKQFLTTNKISWNPEINCFQDIEYNIKCFLSSQSIAFLASKIDWYWRKVDNSTGNSLYITRNYESNLIFLNSILKLAPVEFSHLVKRFALVIIKNSEKRLGLVQFKKLIIPLFLKRIIPVRIFIFLLKIFFKVSIAKVFNFKINNTYLLYLDKKIDAIKRYPIRLENRDLLNFNNVKRKSQKAYDSKVDINGKRYFLFY